MCNTNWHSGAIHKATVQFLSKQSTKQKLVNYSNNKTNSVILQMKLTGSPAGIRKLAKRRDKASIRR